MDLKIKTILYSAILGLPSVAWGAETTTPTSTPPSIPETTITVGDLYTKLIELTSYVFGVGLALALIMMIWAGITYMTAGGDDEKIGAAKKRVIWGLVGATIIIAAWAIITILPRFLGITPPAMPQ